MRIQAAIFDLDGTVVDDEAQYGAAFAKVLRDLGAGVNSDYPHEGGIGVAENWPKLLKKYKIETDKSVGELTHLTQEEYVKRIDEVETKPGFEELAEHLHENGIFIALATSNEWWLVEEVLEKLDLEKYFDSTTTAEEVRSKKPSPEIFMIAAQKLGIEPENCLVFEDSAAGVEAARKAGMRVIAIARDQDLAEELQGADLVIESFEDISTKTVEDL